MTKARALRSKTLIEISVALSDSEDPKTFLANIDAILQQEDNLLEIGFNSGRPDPLQFSQRGLGIEADNSKLVYEFLGPMTRTNGSDPRLWTYLAFASYRDYMEIRWPLDRESWKQRVKDRWLMSTSRRSAQVRHGIARLWWAAYLTHDPTASRPLSQKDNNPFAYTEVALAKEDAFLALFDREISSTPDLLFGALEISHSKPEAFVRRFAREIVREYGYREIGSLSRPALQEALTACAQAASHPAGEGTTSK